MGKIESEKAKERKGERTDLTQNFAEGDKGEAKEKAAEKVGEEIVGRDRRRGGARLWRSWPERPY